MHFRTRRVVVFIAVLLLGILSAAQRQVPAAGQSSEKASTEKAADAKADQPADQAEQEPQAAPAEQADWWQHWDTAKAYWMQELFSIGDTPFHLGQLIRAVLVFLAVLLAAWIAKLILRRTIVRHLEQHAEKSEMLLDDALLAVLRQTKRFVVVLLAAYLGLISLPLSETSEDALHAFSMVVLTIQAAIWANAALVGMLDKAKERRASSDPSAASAFGLMGFFARVAVWSLALLLALSSLGYPIGPLLAGLGVGGVAVAFALQHILGDIFCSIAIVLDKPFVLGDFIIVNDFMGTVENIGIKTTRLRSLGGEQIVFSNADLIGSRVRNYKRMFQRRIVFGFGVVYELSPDKLKQIPETVRSIIESIDDTRFDRAHFKEYGDSSLNFEVVYYVLVPDYNKYMDIQQEINLRLFESFAKDDIAFAYPTREIIMRPTE